MFYVLGFRRMITTEAINSDLIWLVGWLKLLQILTDGMRGREQTAEYTAVQRLYNISM